MDGLIASLDRYIRNLEAIFAPKFRSRGRPFMRSRGRAPIRSYGRYRRLLEARGEV